MRLVHQTSENGSSGAPKKGSLDLLKEASNNTDNNKTDISDTHIFFIEDDSAAIIYVP